MRRPGVARLAAAALLIAAATSPVAMSQPARRLTAVDAIETVRIMDNQPWQASIFTEKVEPASISPDGERYIVRLISGDMKRNGVRLDLISGRLSSLDDAENYERVASLFTSGLGSGHGSVGPDSDPVDLINPLRWLNNKRVAFLWSNPSGIRQVIAVDLGTHQVEFLTSHPTHVRAFDVSSAGEILFVAEAKRSADDSGRRLSEGFVIPDGTDIFALLRGDYSGRSSIDRFDNSEWFVLDRSEHKARKLRIAHRDIDPYDVHILQFAPAGRYALVTSAPERVPREWLRYGEDGDLFKDVMQEAVRNSKSVLGRSVQQFYVVDTLTGASRPLWPAPMSFDAQAAWSASGTSVILAPTYLPLDDADKAGREGHAVAEVNVASARYSKVPIVLVDERVVGIRWLTESELQVDTTRGTEANIQHHRFSKVNGKWVPGKKGESDARRSESARIKLEVRQDQDTAPRLFAIDEQAAKEKLVLDPNPQLRGQITLGQVAVVSGRLPTGEEWHGQLYYPANHVDGKRFALVIQTDDAAPPSNKFSLYGPSWMPGLGPPLISVDVGRLLAVRDIAVLHLFVGVEKGKSTEAERSRLAYEAAAQHLISVGLADASRIGLIGFSRCGWKVEYTLTHSIFPFAAALSADNWDASYFHAALEDWSIGSHQVNGASPFGDGLRTWFERAPGFNADKVHTPLRMVLLSGGMVNVLTKWELFSRLRYLEKPVEFYVVPDVERGSHNTQNPKQLLAVLESTVDWFDFWLNGYEDRRAEKGEQYAQWRMLRSRHEINRVGASARGP